MGLPTSTVLSFTTTVEFASNRPFDASRLNAFSLGDPSMHRRLERARAPIFYFVEPDFTPRWFPRRFPRHFRFRATVTGTAWAMADGETGGPANVSTYVLVANSGPEAGTVRVTLLLDDSFGPSRDFPIAGNSRFKVDIRTAFPFVVNLSYGVMVESLAVRGETPASIETGDAPGSQGVTRENIAHI